MEIKKRYNQKLGSEINEFPDSEMIHGRMVPICYEEGIPEGPVDGLSNYIALATEYFVKQSLSTVFKRMRTDGPGYTQTRKYKKARLREREMVEEGRLQRDPATKLLPIEQHALETRKPLTMSEIRMALAPGDLSLSSIPFSYGNIMNNYLQVDDATAKAWSGPPPGKIQELPEAEEDSLDADGDFEMTNGDVDGDTSWGWEGGHSSDRKELGDLLGECLAYG